MTDWLNPNGEPSPGDGDSDERVSPRSLRPIEGTAGQDWLSQTAREAFSDGGAVEDSAENAKRTPLFDRLSPRAKTGVLAGGLLTVLTLFAGGAGIALMGIPSRDTGEEHVSAQSPSMQATAEDQGTSSDTTKQPVYAGKCDGATPVVEPSPDTLKGSVATFQKAYFSKDAEGVNRILANDSPLKQQDWRRILEDVNLGSSYCVKITPVSPSTVNTELTVKDGSKKTFLQKVTGVNVDGKWMITGFEIRSGSGS